MNPEVDKNKKEESWRKRRPSTYVVNIVKTLLGKLEHRGKNLSFQINYKNTSPLRWKTSLPTYLAGAVISSRQVVQLPLPSYPVVTRSSHCTRAAKKTRLLLGNIIKLDRYIVRLCPSSIPTWQGKL